MDAKTLELLRSVARSYNPTKEEAQALFDKVEEKHREYQEKVKASMPSKLDRQRVYNL